MRRRTSYPALLRRCDSADGTDRPHIPGVPIQRLALRAYLLGWAVCVGVRSLLDQPYGLVPYPERGPARILPQSPCPERNMYTSALFSTASAAEPAQGPRGAYIIRAEGSLQTHLPGRGRRPIKKGRGLDQRLALHLASALAYHLPSWESGRHNL